MIAGARDAIGDHGIGLGHERRAKVRAALDMLRSLAAQVAPTADDAERARSLVDRWKLLCPQGDVGYLGSLMNFAAGEFAQVRAQEREALCRFIDATIEYMPGSVGDVHMQQLKAAIREGKHHD